MARVLIQSMASCRNTPWAKLSRDSRLINAPVRPKKFAQLLTVIITRDEPTVRRNAVYQGPLDERNTSSRYRTTSLNFGRFSGAVMISAS